MQTYNGVYQTTIMRDKGLGYIQCASAYTHGCYLAPACVHRLVYPVLRIKWVRPLLCLPPRLLVI